MDIQWYPGHMAKAVRAMKEDIKLVDIIIELLDARAPYSSRNPDIDELARGKMRLIILNKADLAEKDMNDVWIRYFRDKGIEAIGLDARKNTDAKNILKVIRIVCSDKIERDQKRGIKNRPIKAMVAGIPNVGKSTFINSIAGKAAVKTANTPGVTRGNQWIRINREVDLLDTPGVLWPKFEDQEAGLRLAFLGTINGAITDDSELAYELIKFLMDKKPGTLNARYGVDEQAVPSDEMTGAIAIARSCLLKGGVPDTNRAASLILDDFRSGKLGRITLDDPPERVI